jgi:hypothetical protein
MDIYSNPNHKSKLLNYSELHLFGIEMAFIEFRNYYQIIESSLATEAGKKISHFNIKYNELVASAIEEGYAAHLDQQFAEQVTQLSYYFPHAFRSSFLIQVFSFIEFELKEICNHHHNTNHTDISLGDLKGSSDLDKAKIYLTKVCKVNLNNLQPEWTYLLEVRRVRNALVHHAGIVVSDHPDRKQLVPFIDKEAGIEFKEKVTDRKPDLSKEDLTIMVTGQAFIERLLSMSEELFKKLLETGPVKITH